MPVASGEEELRAREALAEARLFLVQTAAFLLLAFLAWGTGFSRDAADRWLAAWQPAPGGWLEWAAVRFSFVAAWILAYEILLFPVSVVLGGGAEDAAAGRFAAWCKRHLLGVAGESAFLGTVFLAFYALQRFSPGWWWLAAAGLYAFLQIGCGLFADAWILPALHPPRPLEDPALLASVRRAGSRAGLDVRGLCVRETGDRVTVSGLGNRVRVVFPEAMAADGAADAETKAFFAAKAVAVHANGCARRGTAGRRRRARGVSAARGEPFRLGGDPGRRLPRALPRAGTPERPACRGLGGREGGRAQGHRGGRGGGGRAAGAARVGDVVAQDADAGGTDARG